MVIYNNNMISNSGRDSMATPGGDEDVTTAKKGPVEKNSKKRGKSRRITPKVKDFIPEGESPRDTDVLSGRGGASNKHTGNKVCYSMMYHRRAEYQSCKTVAEKKEIAQEIVNAIHKKNGRYLELDKATGRWYISPMKNVLEKTMRGLRETKHIPKWLSATGNTSNNKGKARNKLTTKQDPRENKTPKKKVSTFQSTLEQKQQTEGGGSEHANVSKDGRRQIISPALPPLTSTEENPIQDSVNLSSPVPSQSLPDFSSSGTLSWLDTTEVLKLHVFQSLNDHNILNVSSFDGLLSPSTSLVGLYSRSSLTGVESLIRGGKNCNSIMSIPTSCYPCWGINHGNANIPNHDPDDYWNHDKFLKDINPMSTTTSATEAEAK